MIKRFYISILFYPFIVLFLSLITHLYQGSYGDIVQSVLKVFSTLFILNGIIATIIFIPIYRFLTVPNSNSKIYAVKTLPIYGSLSYIISSTAYTAVHLYTLNQKYENIIQFELIFRFFNRYVLIGGIFTFFLIDNFSIKLKEEIFKKRGILISGERVKIWLKLLLTYFLISLAPIMELYFMISPFVVVPNHIIFNQIVSITITLFVMIGCSAYFITRGFRKPIYLLLDSFSQIQNGKYPETPIVSSDEMGVLTSNFNKMVEHLKERELLKDSFGKYMTKEIASEILKNGLELKGRYKVVTIFFTDIENYTTITERLKPDEVVEMLNLYFSELVNTIQKYNGVVNKFIGDAILAIFNAPLDNPNHVHNAIDCGLEILSKPIVYKGIHLITRIGINTDQVLVGNIGTLDRMEYTVIGDGVNVASRLEQLNKKYSTKLLIGENSYNQTQFSYNFELIGEELLKGKSTPVKVYKVVENGGVS